MKRLGLIFATLGVTAASSGFAQGHTLELRLIVPCKPEMAATLNADGVEKICLAPDVILDRSNILAAHKKRGLAGQDVVRIVIDSKGVAGMSATTANAVPGTQRIAVLYDNAVIESPIIYEPITGNELEITAAPEVLDSLMADLRSVSSP